MIEADAEHGQPDMLIHFMAYLDNITGPLEREGLVSYVQNQLPWPIEQVSEERNRLVIYITAPERQRAFLTYFPLDDDDVSYLLIHFGFLHPGQDIDGATIPQHWRPGQAQSSEQASGQVQASEQVQASGQARS